MTAMNECKHGQLARSCEICERDARIAELEQEISALRPDLLHAAQIADKYEERIEDLEQALSEAIEDIEQWAGYASDYFRDKHDLAGTLAKHRAALGKEVAP